MELSCDANLELGAVREQQALFSEGEYFSVEASEAITNRVVTFIARRGRIGSNRSVLTDYSRLEVLLIL